MAKWSNTRVTQVTYSDYRSCRGGSRWDAIQKARATAEVERIRASLEIEWREAKGERKNKLRNTLHYAKLLTRAIEREEVNYSEWLEIKREYNESGLIIIRVSDSTKDRKHKKHEVSARKSSYVYGSFDCWPPKKKSLIVTRLKEIDRLLKFEVSEAEKKRLLTEKGRYFESEKERVTNLWG